MSGSAYTVSASLNIRGNYTQVFTQLGRSLTGLNRQIQLTEASLNRLIGRVQTLGTVTSRASAVAAMGMSNFRTATQNASAAAQGMNQRLSSQATRLNNMAAAATLSAQAANNMAAAMRRLSQVPPPPRIPPPPRQGAGGSGAGGGRLTRGGVNGIGPVSGINQAARSVGSMITAAGAEQQAMTMLRAQGVSQLDREAMRLQALEMIEQVPGTNLVDAIGAIRETRMALGPSAANADVLRAAPEVLRTARISASVSGRPTAEALRPFARFSATTGGFTGMEGDVLDIERGLEQLRVLQDATIAFSTGEKQGIDPREWEMLARGAGIPLRRMSFEGQAALATLIQERGGKITSTELTAFSDFVVDKKGPKKNLAAAEAAGLRAMTPAAARQATIDQRVLAQRMLAAGRLTPTEAGMLERQPIRPGDFRGRGFAAVRPDIYHSEVLRPLMAAKGADTEDEQLDMISEIMPKTTSRRFSGALMQVREVMEDIVAFRMVREGRARGEGPDRVVLNEGFKNSLANMEAGWNTLMTALGNSPHVVPFLNEMAQTLRVLAEVSREDGSNVNLFMGGLRDALRSFREVLINGHPEIENFKAVIQELAPLFRFIHSATEGMSANVMREIETVKSAFRMAQEAFNDFSGFLGRIRDRILAYLIPEPVREGIRGLNNRVDEARDVIDGIPSRILNGPAVPRELVPNPDAVPMPPSWGGGIRLNNFQPMPGAAGGETVLHTVVQLDGRVLTDVVTRHQGRAASGPIQGPDRFDIRRGISAGGEVLA